jgi:ADP-dependent NAD(P)H-hydrate dehydratase / NAD(P)H-hydrate epimerase
MNCNAIITIDQMRAMDAAAPDTLALMEAAGAAVAREIIARVKSCRVAVLCGPGNNGGDGYVCARHLQVAGWEVWVERIAAPASADCIAMAELWRGTSYAISPDNPMADLFVDALFGAGLSKPLDGHAARLANALTPQRVVAVDVPSGLPGDGGAPTGPYFKSALTVTFEALKPAHVLTPGLLACGEVVVADIGLDRPSVDQVLNSAPRIWRNDPALWRALWPWPDADSHKHRRGKVAVIAAGAQSLTAGAARLSARAALATGAGWVTALIDPAQAALFGEPAALVAVAFDGPHSAAGHDAIVFGPGARRRAETAALARKLIAMDAALVLDAAALSSLADDVWPVARLRGPDQAPLTLTPHEGEFARLFPDISGNKLSRARAAAARAGAIVLLKGADTVIAGPDGRAVINTHATPWLASAGTGDVLAGMVAAALAAKPADPLLAVAACAWLHGEAGRRTGPGLIADNLIAILADVLNDQAPTRLQRV